MEKSWPIVLLLSLVLAVVLNLQPRTIEVHMVNSVDRAEWDDLMGQLKRRFEIVDQNFLAIGSKLGAKSAGPTPTPTPAKK